MNNIFRNRSTEVLVSVLKCAGKIVLSYSLEHTMKTWILAPISWKKENPLANTQ